MNLRTEINDYFTELNEEMNNFFEKKKDFYTIAAIQ